MTTVHGKEECLCSTLLLYLKIEGDATPAAHIHRVRPVESASMTVPGMHPCSCLASYGVFFYQESRTSRYCSILPLQLENSKDDATCIVFTVFLECGIY